MIAAFADPFDALFNLQKSLEAGSSDWLRSDHEPGSIPTHQRLPARQRYSGDYRIAGRRQSSLEIQAKDNTIRIPGRNPSPFPTASASIAASGFQASFIGR